MVILHKKTLCKKKKKVSSTKIHNLDEFLINPGVKALTKGGTCDIMYLGRKSGKMPKKERKNRNEQNSSKLVEAFVVPCARSAFDVRRLYGILCR